MHKVLHRESNRGRGEYGWLKTRYSFSFNDWYEPKLMGFGALRVLNDDRIAPSRGFGQHGHRDMEIITLVTRGAVTHTDNMGNKGVVPAGDVQVMSAGTGVIHAEENASPTEELTLFQLWIMPRTQGVAPCYAQKSVGFMNSTPGLTLLVQPDDAEETGALSINQDARISYAVLDAAHPIEYKLSSPNHGAYIFVIDGTIEAAGEMLAARDALGVWDTDAVSLSAATPATALIIDVPMR